MKGRKYYDQVIKSPEMERLNLLVETLKEEYKYSPTKSKIIQLDKNLERLEDHLAFLKKEPVLLFPKDYRIENPNCIKVVKDIFPTFDFNLILMGNAGVGKSHLGKIIMNNLRRYFPHSTQTGMVVHNNFSIFESRVIYEQYLRSLKNKNENAYYPIISRFTLFDDIGNERPDTVKSHEYVEGIIEKMYSSFDTIRGANVNIITTNLLGNSDKIGRKTLSTMLSARTRDRMRDQYRVLKFTNSTFRKIRHAAVEG